MVHGKCLNGTFSPHRWQTALHSWTTKSSVWVELRIFLCFWRSDLDFVVSYCTIMASISLGINLRLLNNKGESCCGIVLFEIGFSLSYKFVQPFTCPLSKTLVTFDIVLLQTYKCDVLYILTGMSKDFCFLPWLISFCPQVYLWKDKMPGILPIDSNGLSRGTLSKKTRLSLKFFQKRETKRALDFTNSQENEQTTSAYECSEMYVRAYFSVTNQM